MARTIATIDHERLFQSGLWRRMSVVGGEWAHVIASSEEEMDDILAAYRAGDNDRALVIRCIRGTACATETDLLREVSAALQFPCRLANSWEGMEAALLDMSYQRANAAFVLVITQAHALLRKSPHAYRLFIERLNAAAGWWETRIPHDNAFVMAPRPALPFNVLFQTTNQSKLHTMRRLEEAGIQAEAGSLAPFRSRVPSVNAWTWDGFCVYARQCVRLDGQEGWLICQEQPQGAVWTDDGNHVPFFPSIQALDRYARQQGLVLVETDRRIIDLDRVDRWLNRPDLGSQFRRLIIDAWDLFATVANSVGEDEYDTRHLPGSPWERLLFGTNYARVYPVESEPVSPSVEDGETLVRETLNAGLQIFRSTVRGVPVALTA